MMSESYNATVEVDTRDFDEDLVDRVIDGLVGYSPAVSTAETGRMQVIVSLPATDLPQAARTAVAMVESAAGRRAVAVEVMPTAEFDRRNGLDALPELLSVTQVAEQLGVSRQAVLQRLESGSLPGVKVGNAWVVQAGAIRTKERV